MVKKFKMLENFQDFGVSSTSIINNFEKRKKYLKIYPIEEEECIDEKYYKNFLNENLKVPLKEDEPFFYYRWYSDNILRFKEDILEELKNKLVGKTVHIEGKRKYMTKDEIDPIDNIINSAKIKPYYKIKIKDFKWNGTVRDDVYYVNVIDEENKVYFFKKIVDKKTYDRWAKKIEKELKRIEEEKIKKEEMRLKHYYHDPFGEEKWEDDD